MDIYENIVIGNFLYGLGFQLGARTIGKPHAMAVNLLQQTPMDQPLSDLLLEGSSVFRLIEFKRLRNNSNKELAKLWHVEVILKNQNYLTDLIRRCHWYVETQMTRDGFSSFVRPYLQLREKRKGGTMESLIRHTVDDAMSEKNADEERALFHEYIGHLMRITGYSGQGSGALIFAASGDSSQPPKYVAVRNMLDLMKTDRDVMREYQRADLSQAAEINAPKQDLTRSKTLSRGREPDSGPEIGGRSL